MTNDEWGGKKISKKIWWKEKKLYLCSVTTKGNTCLKLQKYFFTISVEVSYSRNAIQTNA
nr:MAG TPA: hypothetical protein [Caudoviricetes sp.]